MGEFPTRPRSARARRRAPKKRRPEHAQSSRERGPVIRKRGKHAESQLPASFVLRGIGVSPGVIVDVVHCVHESTIALETAGQLMDEQVLAELARFNEAREGVLADLRTAHDKVATQIGRHEAAIFTSHAAILGDEAFSNQVSRYILEKHKTAEAALQAVLGDYEPVFAAIRSEYLKERIADLRDIVRRLRKRFSDTSDAQLHRVAGILAVDELLPSDLIPLDNWRITGIVTQTGGRTSHAAILARSRGIPAVSGIEGLFDKLQSGDNVIVDGHEGIVFVNPDGETERAYRKRQREYLHVKEELVANADRPAVSADGQPVELLANVNSLADAQAAAKVGAAGVGLFRTEYLFLAHPDVPDEEQQIDAYRSIMMASPGKAFTIRTLDLGGDKALPYLGHPGEANPFMGWRSIRLSFEYPEFFLRQIRAILQAAADQQKQTRLMFPMITTREEMLKVRRMVARAQRQLETEQLAYGPIQVGLMLEVPAAAIAIDTFLDIADFVSIGSNDLVQYLTAADRDNPKVNHLCQPLGPAVLRLLATVIDTCKRARKPVTVCGEMASSPRAIPLLFGMGLRSFSMSPTFVPTIKELVGHLTEEWTGPALKRAVRMKTARQVVSFMDRQLQDMCPNLVLLETS